jgi:ATP-dependent HslUV protease ATP-binding subunit HslU
LSAGRLRAAGIRAKAVWRLGGDPLPPVSAERTPREIAAELDRYIVGQDAAKRAVAVALRNRYRRRGLPEGLREEVVPKNILMIGPTGVGKTEIARRIARMVGAPFVKVEATRFTEVGYVGRDVDGMIRDLVEVAVRMVRAEHEARVQSAAQERAEERLLDALLHLTPRRRAANPLEAMWAASLGTGPQGQDDEAELQSRRQATREQRAALRQRLLAGELEGETVELDLPEPLPPAVGALLGGEGPSALGSPPGLGDLLGGLLPRPQRRRRLSVAEARRLLVAEEASRLVDQERVLREAIDRAEQTGIVFIDEIDKIAGRDAVSGPDVSREGVQRDILPIVEGSTVQTRYGPVRTDHMLFIAAGAFHVSRPGDLIPELQGRFPIRVELQALTRQDLRRILEEPANSLVRQYAALLAADGVRLTFTPDGLDAVARVAHEVNEGTEDIGARRLHTVMEKLLEDLAFAAPDGAPSEVQVDAAYVEQRLQGLVADRDARRLIL